MGRAAARIAERFNGRRFREPGLNIGQILKDLRLALFSIYILPLVVIAYLYTEYIYPMFSSSGNETAGLGISAVITFAVILSILGLALITKMATNSVGTLRSLNERMDKLLSKTQEFQEAGYTDTLINSFAKSAKELLEAEASSILLYDQDGNLRFEYVEGPASGILKGKVMKAGEGIAGWAAREGRPIIKNNVRQDPRYFKQFGRENGFRTRSVICAPLIFSGETLGVIEVVNKLGGGEFTEQDLDALVSLSGHAAAAIRRNKEQEEMKSDLVQLLDMVVTAADNHLPDKQGHSRRVALYSVKLAKSLGLPEGEVKDIYFGAILHDIGFLKLGVSEYMDREKVKLHPTLGADMVKKISQWSKVAPMIRDHHEHFNGGGYPQGLSGHEISLGARIIALAEAFDVLTHKNYKDPVRLEDALDEVRTSAGTQFDPELADIFIGIMKKEDVMRAA